jgi:hypothetical protein
MELNTAKEEYSREDLETLITRLSNKIYEAAEILETHERHRGGPKGCLMGNGHHARQSAAMAVVNQFISQLHPVYRDWYTEERDSIYGRPVLKPVEKEPKEATKL